VVAGSAGRSVIDRASSSIAKMLVPSLRRVPPAPESAVTQTTTTATERESRPSTRASVIQMMR
jgi:hypothetical protein